MKTSKSAVHRAVLQALACASGLVLAAPHAASAGQAKFDIAAQSLKKTPKTAGKTGSEGSSSTHRPRGPVRLADSTAAAPAAAGAAASDLQTEPLAEVIVVGQKEAISKALQL